LGQPRLPRAGFVEAVMNGQGSVGSTRKVG
jgi:hypothetical protein